MPLKMGEGNDNVCVHNGPPDFSFLHILAVNGNRHLSRSLKPVPNHHMTSRGKGMAAVLIGRIQMVQGVLPASHIQGVAVSKKYLAACGLNHIHQDLGIIRAQIGKVSRLSKMNLNCRILIAEINIHHAGLPSQPLQLLQEIFL